MAPAVEAAEPEAAEVVAVDVAAAADADPAPQSHRRVGGTLGGLPAVAVLPEVQAPGAGAYAWHRPKCALFGDEPITPQLLARAELRNHLPCGLLGAIVQVESGGRPHRISSAGAMGPMQLIPPTARALGVSDPFDTEQSVDGAARYLHTQFATFRSIRLAAAAYNAGPGAIVGRRVPQNGQTEIYVHRVLRGARRRAPRALRAGAPFGPGDQGRPARARPQITHDRHRERKAVG